MRNSKAHISDRLFRLVVCLVALFVWGGEVNAAEPLSPVQPNAPQTAYLRAYVNRDNVATGERLIYEVRLYSPVAEVVGVDRVRRPKFERLPHAQTAPDSRMEPTVDPYGRQWFSAVIDRFFLEVREDGKHAVKGGAYDITTNMAPGSADSFWNAMPEGEVETVSLKAPDVKLKSSQIPTKGCPKDFSGAVGDFSIRIMAPHGYVKAGENFLMRISISGEGNLDHAALPDVKECLPRELQLISINDERSHYVKDGALGSEMEIECLVCPVKAGEFKISPVRYSYYNSLNHKYVTTSSDSVTIKAVDTINTDDSTSNTVDV